MNILESLNSKSKGNPMVRLSRPRRCRSRRMKHLIRYVTRNWMSPANYALAS